MPSNYLRQPEFESLESDILSAVRESLKGLSDPRLLEVEGASDVSRNHATGLEYVHGEGFVLRLADEEGSYLVTLRRLYRYASRPTPPPWGLTPTLLVGRMMPR